MRPSRLRAGTVAEAPEASALVSRTVLDRDGVTLADVACRHRAGCGQTSEHAIGHMLVLVRRGCFVRRVDGVETLLDPTLAYCMQPGQEQRYDHPHDDGDDCTSLVLEPRLLASLWGGDPRLPSGPLSISPRVDLQHRLLLAAARRGDDPHELVERAIELAACTLEHVDARRVASGRPATARTRRALVDGAREALIVDPSRSLPELAAALGASPHHLSRVFRAATGATVARHRMRLRARSALERLAGGEADLARLAAELGFADQSHLCRVMRSETGQTPLSLRRLLVS
ncbi:MAG TPA: helix-turn-helix transcriptional regulator [Conexibacter sp.]|nr:helix-turn-helix transcriptional regulator [Conexibacter sp.]